MKSLAFSIPIYKYKVENWNIKKKKLLDLFDKSENKIVGNVITSPFNIQTDILLDEIKLFEREIKLNLYLNNVWFQKYEKDMDHSVHNHGPIGFSSVCFVEYDKNFHQATTFISPFGNYITRELEKYQPEVDEGDIIFFPSNLPHYAPVNLSNKARIIMSFNLLIEPKKTNTFVYG